MADIVCPDDSTTCLLQALLNDNTSKLILEQLIETNNAYDWNPVTLGFTVAIGVLAFIVAIVTVFQGCLAAGPGRLKAGRQAIGPWYRHSDVSFSWYQLAARSTAKTPFIDVGALESEVSTHAHKEQEESVTLRTRLLFGSDMSQHANDSAPYNASWANLLGQACVTKTKEFGILESCPTDHIEDSLRAAPASGWMKSLVFLATYVNDSCTIVSPKEGEDRFFSVRGLSSQLIFRDLETMGPAVAFVSFGSSESMALYRKPWEEDMLLKKNDLIASFKLFSGKVPSRDIELNVLRFANHAAFTKTRRRLRCPILLALCIGDVILRPRAFPKKSMGLIEAIAALTGSSIWRFGKVKKFLASFLELSYRVTRTKPSDQKVDWKFPARRSEAPFLKLKSLWKSENATSCTGNRADYLAEKLKIVKKQEDRARRKVFSPFRWEGKIEIASIVYALTRSITHEQKYFPEKFRCSSKGESILEQIRRDRLATDWNRVLLQNEIVCVDDWLRRKEEGGSNVVVHALMVLMKIVDTHRGLPTVKHREFDPKQPNSLSDGQRSDAMKSAFVCVEQEKDTFTSDAASSSDDESEVDDVDNDLDSTKGSNSDPPCDKMTVDETIDFWDIVEVLRYRALLYAAMLELCADSSDFRGDYTDFKVKII